MKVKYDGAAARERLERVLRAHHDCRNALCGAMANAQLLEGMMMASERSGPELRQRFRALAIGLERSRALLESPDSLGLRVGGLEPVAVADVVQDVVDEVRRCYPAVRIQYFVPTRRQVALAQLRGGTLSLHRVIENVVINACQGDGRRSATSVTLAWHSEHAKHVVIECVDDGPGFAPELLNVRRAKRVRTTKRSGCGLGLSTARRLLRASGGGLELMNREQGGALVRITVCSVPARSNGYRKKNGGDSSLARR